MSPKVHPSMNESHPGNNPDDKPAYETPEETRPASAAPTEGQLEKEMPTVKPLDYSPAEIEHDPYAAFRLRVFWHFIVSFGLATLGTQIMSVALQWELAKQTHNPLVLGFLGGVQALPVILLALPAGHVSDTFSRKAVLMLTQVILVICPLVLASLTYFAHDWSHYVAATFGIVLINAIALTFARPRVNRISRNSFQRTFSPTRSPGTARHSNWRPSPARRLVDWSSRGGAQYRRSYSVRFAPPSVSDSPRCCRRSPLRRRKSRRDLRHSSQA